MQEQHIEKEHWSNSSSASLYETDRFTDRLRSEKKRKKIEVNHQSDFNLQKYPPSDEIVSCAEGLISGVTFTRLF